MTPERWASIQAMTARQHRPYKSIQAELVEEIERYRGHWLRIRDQQTIQAPSWIVAYAQAVLDGMEVPDDVS